MLNVFTNCLNCLFAEAGNSNVDINHILTDLQDDPGYSNLLDIKPVDRRAQGPGWVSLANTEIQVRKLSIKGGIFPQPLTLKVLK